MVFSLIDAHFPCERPVVPHFEAITAGRGRGRRHEEESAALLDDGMDFFFLGNGARRDLLGDEANDVSAFFGEDIGRLLREQGCRTDLVRGCRSVVDDDADKDALFLHAFAAAALFSGGDRGEMYVRDNGRAWEAKVRRSDAYFFKRTHMFPASFHALLTRVRPYLRSTGDGFVRRRPTIEPAIRLMVVLFWHGHGGSQFVTCEAADMAESTFSLILRETISAILHALPAPSFPQTEAEQAAVAQGFIDNLDCRIQKVAGVIDDCLIRISTPPTKHKAAFNTRKCFYGMNLLSIVDSEKRFVWTRGDLRGSMSDSRGFREIRWYEDQVTSRPKLHPGCTLLADGEFALETWLLKPYTEEHLTSIVRKMFNYFVCSPRTVVENAFGLFKGRWRVLHSGIFAETEFTPVVAEACVWLHNFLLDQG